MRLTKKGDISLSRQEADAILADWNVIKSAIVGVELSSVGNFSAAVRNLHMKVGLVDIGLFEKLTELLVEETDYNEH